MEPCRRVASVVRPNFFLLGVACGLFCMFWYLSSRHHSARGATTYTASAVNRHTHVKVLVSRLHEMGATLDLECMAGTASRPIHLFVAVLSTTDRAQTRLTARKTWMIYNLPREMTTTMRFMIGTNGLSEQQVEKLREEQMTYGDLVMFDTHNDTYRHLTKKVQLAIQWAVSNVHFDYLLKTDDDVIVHLQNFVTELIKLGCPDNLYWGFPIAKTPDAEGKWKDTKWSRLCKRYLPYRAGLGYVIGWQVIKAAAMYGDHLKKLFLEDVSMGLWLSPYKLTRVGNYWQFILGDSILQFIRGGNCPKDFIVAHQGSAKQFEVATTNLMKTGRYCT